MSLPSPRHLIASAVLCACVPLAAAQTPTEAELARRLDQLAAELAAVKAQLAALQRERAAASSAPNAPPAANASGAAPAATTVPATAPPAAMTAAATKPAEPSTVVTSYGEINYNRPVHASENAQADLRRFVIGLQHRTDEKTKIVSELEVEHAVS
ncbi:MAG TPA: hypothetical protein VMU47_17405, partial [Caldimonas sp.]|nr:hypothetical protein [Caldimonas sp.]